MSDRPGSRQDESRCAGQRHMLATRQYCGRSRCVRSVRVHHRRDSHRPEERLLNFRKELLTGGDVAAANEDRGVRQVRHASREDRSVDKADDVFGCDAAVGKQLIDAGVDRDDSVKDGRLRVSVELNQDFAHRYSPTEISNRAASAPGLSPKWFVARELAPPGLRNHVCTETQRPGLTLKPGRESYRQTVRTSPRRTGAWRSPSWRPFRRRSARSSWRERSTAWWLRSCIGRFSCRRWPASE